jgi:hypothetical protein
MPFVGTLMYSNNSSLVKVLCMALQQAEWVIAAPTSMHNLSVGTKQHVVDLLEFFQSMESIFSKLPINRGVMTSLSTTLPRIGDHEARNCFALSEQSHAVSPDERTILYPEFDQDGSDLMLVENFY